MKKKKSAIYTIVSLCPICSTVELFGKIDMSGQEIKYICPSCNARHYGEPEIDGPGLICSKCTLKTDRNAWKTIKMETGEKVHGPMQTCRKCSSKLSEGCIALIETKDGTDGKSKGDRTGNIYFVDPSKELLEYMGNEKMAYVNESVISKMKQKQGTS